MEFLQKLTVGIIVAVFFLGRHTWSFLVGKREKTKVPQEIVSSRFLISLIIGFLLPFFLLLNLFNLHNLSEISNSPLIIWAFYTIGLILSMIGLIFMLLTRWLRKDDWGVMGDETGEVLFTNRIYSITRHPYYIGATLVYMGVYLILNSWFIAVTLYIIFFMSKVIKREELYLENKFGGRWMEYKKRVGIIPFL